MSDGEQTILRYLVYRLRALFRRGSVEAEMDDELRFHFEQEVNKYEKSGLPHREVVRRARRENSYDTHHQVHQLTDESERMAACLCSAVDVVTEAECLRGHAQRQDLAVRARGRPGNRSLTVHSPPRRKRPPEAASGIHAIGGRLNFQCSVAFIACYIPARRAAMIDPVSALRVEA